MITAIVSIDTEQSMIPEVAQAVADLDGVQEVYSVAGEADLIAIVKVTAHDNLADVIAGAIGKITGVLATRTNIAFRTYSQRDLDVAFDLGLDAG